MAESGELLRPIRPELPGGAAVIHVGAATETAMKEKRARLEDALHATRAAVEEGIVPGRGALLCAQQRLKGLTLDDADEQIGVRIIERALEEPIRQISINAGVEGSIVVQKVHDTQDKSYGCNARTDEYEDLVAAASSTPPRSRAPRCRTPAPSPACC